MIILRSPDIKETWYPRNLTLKSIPTLFWGRGPTPISVQHYCSSVVVSCLEFVFFMFLGSHSHSIDLKHGTTFRRTQAYSLRSQDKPGLRRTSTSFPHMLIHKPKVKGLLAPQQGGDVVYPISLISLAVPQCIAPSSERISLPLPSSATSQAFSTLGLLRSSAS